MSKTASLPDFGPQPALLQYYQQTDESGRLLRVENELELVRTRDILQRHLPSPPAKIIDVGGGPAVHSCWLAELGFRTHLVDIVPRHIRQAQRICLERRVFLAGLQVGDARSLPFPDHSADAVLMLGPLYHLVWEEDRRVALGEAFRVLRPGGVLIAQAISRYAAVVKLLSKQMVGEQRLRDVATRTTHTGTHCPDPDLDFFMTAHFHRPDELQAEIVQAGFSYQATLAVEGPIRLLGQAFVPSWQEHVQRKWLLELACQLEAEPSLLGVSGHIMAIARKGDGLSK